MTPQMQTELYENPAMWGKQYPETVLQRARLTVSAVPGDVQSILDVGAGDGLLVNALRDRGYDPVALDISRRALRYIKGEKRVQGNGDRLPFFSNTFDLVFACEVLEHLPVCTYEEVLHEIERVAKKYIIVTVPFQERLEWNDARCPACGCIFNGAYHVRSFAEDNLKSLFKEFHCSGIKDIVNILHPDRTCSLELFIRHKLAGEYLYFSPSCRCPLCLHPVDKKPKRSWIGWIAAAMRYGYRLIFRKHRSLWHLAVYEKGGDSGK